MIKKEEAIKKIVWIKQHTSALNRAITPFFVILAFVITLPVLTGIMAKWLFALVTLLVAVEISISQIEKTWKQEVSTEELIIKNKETINKLNDDIERLEKRLKKKNKVKEALKQK